MNGTWKASTDRPAFTPPTYAKYISQIATLNTPVHNQVASMYGNPNPKRILYTIDVIWQMVLNEK